MLGTVDLVAQLRNRLKDDKPIVLAFTLTATGNAKKVIVETTRTSFVVTVEGGESVDAARLPLGTPQYGTVGRVIEALARTRGLAVQQAEDGGVSDHPSLDLHVTGLVDIAGNKSCAVRHRLYADTDLLSFIQEAISFHNPNYTLGTVPPNEVTLVLLKAQSIALYSLANDTVRRKAMGSAVSDLLALADRHNSQYKQALERLGKNVSVPKTDESNIGSGEFINGKQFRKSPRYGYDANSRSALNIQPPTLYQPEDRDVEDVSVRLHFSVNRDESFSTYELWRDVRPTVERSSAGPYRDKWRGSDPQPAWSGQQRGIGPKGSTAHLVAGGNLLDDSPVDFDFGTVAEHTGRNGRRGLIMDGPYRGTEEPLEPSGTYYYRLYGMSINGELLGSNVIRVTTKTAMARFKRLYSPPSTFEVASDAILPFQGPLAGGTVVTILGTGFTDKTIVMFGPKRVEVLSVTSTVLTVVAPAFSNPSFIGRKLDVVLLSNNETNTDMIHEGWSVLA